MRDLLENELCHVSGGLQIDGPPPGPVTVYEPGDVTSYAVGSYGYNQIVSAMQASTSAALARSGNVSTTGAQIYNATALSESLVNGYYFPGLYAAALNSMGYKVTAVNYLAGP